jgi:hypothetical protein
MFHALSTAVHKFLAGAHGMVMVSSNNERQCRTIADAMVKRAWIAGEEGR